MNGWLCYMESLRNGWVSVLARTISSMVSRVMELSGVRRGSR